MAEVTACKVGWVIVLSGMLGHARGVQIRCGMTDVLEGVLSLALSYRGLWVAGGVHCAVGTAAGGGDSWVPLNSDSTPAV
jgi:hypothetical protein